MTYKYASRPFTASYHGTCAECLNDIDEGDEVCMLDDEAVHEDCVPEDRINPNA